MTQRHNEVRDVICDLASMVWGQYVILLIRATVLLLLILEVEVCGRDRLWHCLMCVS